MNVQGVPRIGAAARLDRLPLFSFHRRILALLAFCFFFELGDINTFAPAAPAIRMQWGLSVVQIGYVISGTFFGMFIGATFGGLFADKVGRKKALILATLCYSVFSLANAFAWELYGLIALRVLTGVGLSAMTAIGITYIAEMVPGRARGGYQGWIMAIGLAGIPVTALVARIFVPMADWGWRAVFVWGAIGIVFPLFARHLEELPRWYEQRGDLAAADAVLARIEARALAECASLPPVHAVPAPAARARYGDLFAAKVLPSTLMLLVVWIFQTIGFYGFSQFAPTLLVAHGFTLVNSLTWTTAMQLGGLPGAALAASISDRWQRKWLIALFALLVALCGISYGLTFNVMAIVVFGFLVTMFFQGFAPMLYAYTAECFRTGVRSSGTGLAYGVGRLANVFGPLFIAMLYARNGYLSVFAFIAACWVIVALTVGLFGPKTQGAAL